MLIFSRFSERAKHGHARNACAYAIADVAILPTPIKAKISQFERGSSPLTLGGEFVVLWIMFLTRREVKRQAFPCTAPLPRPLSLLEGKNGLGVLVKMNPSSQGL